MKYLHKVCPDINNIGGSIMFGVEYSNSYMKRYKTDFKRTGLCENEGRKDMFYLTTYSTYILYVVGHMLKDHLDSERQNPLFQ